MRRRVIEPRPDWEKLVESQGLLFHSTGKFPYWNESAYYEFTAAEIDKLAAVTAELGQMCINAVGRVIEQGRFAELGIPSKMVPFIVHTWQNETPAIYDRFDLVWDGTGDPKLLEMNGDTPTSLLEAAAIQWLRFEEYFSRGYDQWNSLEPKLVAKWKELIGQFLFPGSLHFAHEGGIEERMTVGYLMKTALDARAALRAEGRRADCEIVELRMDHVGWDEDAKCFVDLANNPIVNIFKLFPWETMFSQVGAQYLTGTMHRMFWMEPAWNVILANKGLLAVLWEMYPGHPNLLPAFIGDPKGMDSYARKPLCSREGANVQLVQSGRTLEETSGPCGAEGYVYQQLACLPDFAGNHPVLGSWLIDWEPAGLGIRESDKLITTDLGRFVPHLLKIAP